jgi:hypothetical protein
LMLNIAPAHTMKKNTIVNTSQNFDTSITLICVNIRTNLAQTKHKKKKTKLKLVLSYEKILTKPKKFVRHKIVTNKFGGAQTKTYYTQ